MWPFDNVASSAGGRPGEAGFEAWALPSTLKKGRGFCLKLWGTKGQAQGRGYLAAKQSTWRLCQHLGEARAPGSQVTGWVAAKDGTSQSTRH